MRKIKISEILSAKGNEVFAIRPDATILDAVNMLVIKKVGSLMVTEGETIAGIITERDILNENARRHDRIDNTRISEVMTRKVVYGRPDNTLDDVMGVMTERRIRHLPILADNKLVGMVSIGDVVKAQLGEAETVIEHLHKFITSQYPA